MKHFLALLIGLITVDMYGILDENLKVAIRQNNMEAFVELAPPLISTHGSEILLSLIEEGYAPIQDERYCEAVLGGSAAVEDYLQEQGKQRAQMIRFLTLYGVSICEPFSTPDGVMTPLHRAALLKLGEDSCPRISVISYLLEAGADGRAQDEFGRTPLRVFIGSTWRDQISETCYNTIRQLLFQAAQK